jgi:hypothetical protein
MQAKFGAAPADVLMVVRGFANEEHRMEETIKAIKHIAEWRDKVNIRLNYSHETSSASKKQSCFLIKLKFAGGLLRILREGFRWSRTVP